MRRCAFLVLLLASASARAWEPRTPADVQARIDELRAAWEGKSPEQIEADKLQRAKQARPEWVSRNAWKLELGPVTYYFAVGRAPQDASVPLPSGTGSAGAVHAGSGGAARTLDWYWDEGSGVLYALVVDAR
jgi:hypothetical protein